MATAKKATEFDPREHLMTWEASKKVGDRYVKVDVEYLPTKWRLVWLRERYPKAIIETSVEQDPAGALVRAVVTLDDGLYATGHAYITSKSFGRAVEKAETQAVGRALAFLGFGTEFAYELDSDEGPNLDNMADSPTERETQKAAGGSRDASQSSAKPQQKQQAASNGSAAPRRSSRSGGKTKEELESTIDTAGVEWLVKRVEELGLDEYDVVARIETRFGKKHVEGDGPATLSGVLSSFTVGQARALAGELERMAEERAKEHAEG